MKSVAAQSKLEQIAQEAGVSVRTVYRVLQGENKETWPSSIRRGKRIREISQRLDFSPDANARGLRTGKKMQIAVLLRNTENVTFRGHYPEAFEIILGINEAMEPAGYCVMLATLGDVLHPRNAHSRIFRERLLDGLVVISQMPSELHPALEDLTPNCLWVHSNVWRDKNCLRRDEVHAGHVTAGALVNLGYKELVWLGPPLEGPDRHYSEAERLKGVQQAAAEGGASLRVIRAIDVGEFAGRYAELRRLLRPEVGFVAYSSQYARWLMHCAQALQRNAPYDFGLVCCDDSRLVANQWPGLSRMGFDQFELGRQVGAMMLENLSGDSSAESQLVCGSWIAGDTAWGPWTGRDF